MKTRTLFLFIVLGFIFPAISYSQGYILRRALNRQIDKEIDTALDKKVREDRNKAKEKAEKDQEQSQEAGQNTGNKPSDQYNQSQSRAKTAGLFGNKVDLKYNEVYSFNSRMYSQMEMYGKNDVTKMDYYLYFSKNSPTAGIETRKINTKEGGTPVASQMIMDGENKCFIMLSDMNGMKMGIISAIPDSVQGKHGESAKSPVVTKTGNSKTISGFRCEEYLYKFADSNEYSKMWFTKDAILNVDKRAWTKSGMPASYGYAGFDKGIIMAWESYDKDNKMIAKSEVKEINNNYNHSMSVKDYTLRQMNANQNQKNK